MCPRLRRAGALYAVAGKQRSDCSCTITFMNTQYRLQLEALFALSETLATMADLKVAFQGGTCLHLCHGSPRFSEDLDFLAAGNLAELDQAMAQIANTVSKKMEAQGFKPVLLAGRGGKRTADGMPHNPRLYQLVMAGARPDLPAIRVRVEFMGVLDPQLARYSSEMRAPLLDGMRASVMAELPSGSLAAIEADKVVALALRRAPKARDVFDLGWIGHQRAGEARALKTLEASRSMYGDAPGLRSILTRASERLAAFTPQAIADEIHDFLPKALTPAYAESLKSEAGAILRQYRTLLDRLEQSHDPRP